MHEMLTARWNATSLRTKVTGVAVLLLTLGLTVAGFGSATVLHNALIESVDARVATAIEDPVISVNGDCSTLKSSLPTDYFIGIYSATGTPLCSNRDDEDAQPAISSMPLGIADAASTPFTVDGTTKNNQWRVAAVASIDTVSKTPLSVVIGLSLLDTEQTVAKFAAIFLFFGLTVVILGGALTRLLVTSTFSPLREVEATAARFAAGDFTQRLSGATPNTEVGRLNRSLNSMLSRIDDAFADRARTIDQMRRFVGDASHELRTPLVSVRGYAELYRMGALPDKDAVAQAMERIEKEAIRMSELVGDLLELARIDEAKPLQLAEVDLVPLARDAALDAMASQPGRTVSVVITDTTTDETQDQPTDAPATPPQSPQATGPIRFAGATIARLRSRRGRTLKIDPTVITVPVVVTPSTKAVIVAEENKIRQVLTNLMGNAMRFTPNTSPIEIGVEVNEVEGVAVLSVIDHGEGIPPQIPEKIFQRFWRADTSRNRDTGGSGLGLAIVASIVNAHNGEIAVVETPGGGATFRVILPVLQRSAASESSTATL